MEWSWTLWCSTFEDFVVTFWLKYLSFVTKDGLSQSIARSIMVVSFSFLLTTRTAWLTKEAQELSIRTLYIIFYYLFIFILYSSLKRTWISMRQNVWRFWNEVLFPRIKGDMIPWKSSMCSRVNKRIAMWSRINKRIAMCSRVNKRIAMCSRVNKRIAMCSPV